MARDMNRWRTGSSSPQVTTSTRQSSFPTEISRKAISKLAYEKFCARGRRHGFDQQDWLEAERELKAEALKRRNN